MFRPGATREQLYRAGYLGATYNSNQTLRPLIDKARFQTFGRLTTLTNTTNFANFHAFILNNANDPFGSVDATQPFTGVVINRHPDQHAIALAHGYTRVVVTNAWVTIDLFCSYGTDHAQSADQPVAIMWNFSADAVTFDVDAETEARNLWMDLKATPGWHWKTFNPNPAAGTGITAKPSSNFRGRVTMRCPNIQRFAEMIATADVEGAIDNVNPYWSSSHVLADADSSTGGTAQPVRLNIVLLYHMHDSNDPIVSGDFTLDIGIHQDVTLVKDLSDIGNRVVADTHA